MLGDLLYQLSSEVLGDPAGLLVVLQVPQVYLLAGAILYGALGLVVQAIVNWQRGWRAGMVAGSDGHCMQA